MKILVAGWAGTGKSTLALAMQARYLPALDTDEIPNLSSWQDRRAGKKVEVDYDLPIDFGRLDWLWAPPVMERVLADYGDLFLCGCAGNLWDFMDRFDHFFVLTIDRQTQRERLTNRQNGIYGKEPSVLEYTLAAQQRFVAKAAKTGAVKLDAAMTTPKLIDRILELSYARR